MKQATKTCFISDDNHVACAMTDDGRFAYIENDPQGIKMLAVCETLDEAKELVIGYEKAMNEFWEVFK